MDCQSKVRREFVNGQPKGIGEIDAETPRFIIEITGSPKPGKVNQLIGLKNNKLLNPERKEVVLFAPNMSSSQQIKTYEKLGVKVVNSMEQLFEYAASKGGF